jgi:hypothetical protein
MVTEALRHIQAGLAALLDAPTILVLCRAVGYQGRLRILDPVTTVHLIILQILPDNTACSHPPHLAARRLTASAVCQACTRLPLVVWQQLRGRTSTVCELTTHDEGRWRGHCTFLVDGSSFSMPDTLELQESLGQPRGQHPGCGFPVAYLLALFHEPASDGGTPCGRIGPSVREKSCMVCPGSTASRLAFTHIFMILCGIRRQYPKGMLTRSLTIYSAASLV